MALSIITTRGLSAHCCEQITTPWETQGITEEDLELAQELGLLNQKINDFDTDFESMIEREEFKNDEGGLVLKINCANDSIMDRATTIRKVKKYVDAEEFKDKKCKVFLLHGTLTDEEIKRKVTAQILDFFFVDNMEFGQEFLKVELERKIFQLSEIRFATIDNIDDIIPVDHNEIIQLNNFSLDIVYL